MQPPKGPLPEVATETPVVVDVAAQINAYAQERYRGMKPLEKRRAEQAGITRALKEGDFDQGLQVLDYLGDWLGTEESRAVVEPDRLNNALVTFDSRLSDSEKDMFRDRVRALFDPEITEKVLSDKSLYNSQNRNRYSISSAEQLLTSGRRNAEYYMHQPESTEEKVAIGAFYKELYPQIEDLPKAFIRRELDERLKRGLTTSFLVERFGEQIEEAKQDMESADWNELDGDALMLVRGTLNAIADYGSVTARELEKVLIEATGGRGNVITTRKKLSLANFLRAANAVNNRMYQTGIISEKPRQFTRKVTELPQAFRVLIAGSIDYDTTAQQNAEEIRQELDIDRRIEIAEEYVYAKKRHVAVLAAGHTAAKATRGELPAERKVTSGKRQPRAALYKSGSGPIS